jgi:hypothetical protein
LSQSFSTVQASLAAADARGAGQTFGREPGQPFLGLEEAALLVDLLQVGHGEAVAGQAIGT